MYCVSSIVISFVKQFVFPKSNAIVISVMWTKVLWYGSEGRKRYDRIETRFIALFYGKNEVSAETIFIFIFYCATVSRENFIKLAVLFSDYFGIKNKTGWWFHDFKGHKIMKPPKSVGKKKWNWRHAAAPRPSVSFFFPTDFGRFHNFSPLKIMKPQPVSFLSQNNRKQTASFIKFHVKLGTKKKKVSS